VTFGESWLPAGTWLGLTDRQEVEDGASVVLGFDGSYNGDSTALIGCTMDGYLFEVGVWERPETVTDWVVPRAEVDVVIDEAFTKWQVVELACDPARWTLYMDEWAERYGDDRVIEYPNNRERMVPATAKFYDAAVNGLLSHDGSRTLTRHVDNAVIKQLPGGRYVLRKDHPNRKIDAAVAAVMAYDRATWRRETEVEVTVMMV
jgi:phage terminase large subunit-like protein